MADNFWDNMVKDAKKIEAECLSRITTNSNETNLQNTGMSTELLCVYIEECFYELYEFIHIDSLSECIQTIEAALNGQTDFLYRLRKCLFGLNDFIANSMAIKS